MKIIGHRGASYDAPENTLASFRTAFEQGADGIECDVMLSKDGQLVVFHDDTLIRTTGVPGLVAEATFAELHSLDAGKRKHERYAGERIPLLTELLAIVPAGKFVFIELKSDKRCVDELRQVLAASQIAREDVVLISFDEATITECKRKLPAYAAYWVVQLDGFAKFSPTDMIASALSMKSDGLDLSADAQITPELVKRCIEANLPVYVWTVNDPLVARSLKATGVAGIATDRPGWMRSELGH